tara:strand:- start:1517 stop:2077 length:561 start_codon:yes stop_codon:yes gene_type:complete
MKWLCKHDNLEIVQTEPTKRTIQIVRQRNRFDRLLRAVDQAEIAEGDQVVDNLFLHFPHMVFARRACFMPKPPPGDDPYRHFIPVQWNPHQPYFEQDETCPDLMGQKLFVGLSNKTVYSPEDVIYPLPLPQVMGDGMISDGNNPAHMDSDIRPLINEFWNTAFPIQEAAGFRPEVFGAVQQPPPST